MHTAIHSSKIPNQESLKNQNSATDAMKFQNHKICHILANTFNAIA